MCFNTTSSLSAFAIGLVCLIIMIQRKMFFFGMFYFFIIVMQLLEYFGHIALEEENDVENNRVSSLILLLLFIQPVAFALSAGWVKFKDKSFQHLIGPVIAVFSLFFIGFYAYLTHTDTMRISYLAGNCESSVCRLDWSFFKSNIFLSLIFLCFYFFLFMYTIDYFNLSRKFTESVGFLSTLLALSIAYMIFVDKIHNAYRLLSGFGSIWCIMAVLVGPFVLFVSK